MHKAIQMKCKRLLSFVLVALIVITMIPTVTAEAAAATSMTAEQVVKDMTVGFNIGNTMDAKEDSHASSSRETAWGNPKITKEFVEAIGAAGFNTVRIPVSWGQYTAGADYQIPDWWMSRVHEVVDYAIDNDMYVILNTHHDLLYYAPTTGRKAESEKYFKSVWTQIAKEFKNYDSHLVFETMNEPRLEGHSEEWWFNRNSPSSDVQTAIQCINDYNQVALDAIRATGGNNATRCVMVPGYDASTEGCMTAGFKMPKDSATDRLILSVHAYTPYDFTLNSYGTDKFTDKSAIDSVFNDINSKFLSKGIPVIIGEMGASNKNNTAERVKWADYYWGKAANYSTVAMCLWDNNILTDSSNPGECHRYFDRNSYQITFPEIFDTIMKYVDGTPAKSASGQENQGGNHDSKDEQNQGNQGQAQPEVTADATLLNTYGAEYGYIGTCINSWQLKDASTLAKIKKQYNSVTLENEMKPDAILGDSAKLMSVAEAKAMGYVVPDSYKESTVPVLKFSTVDEVMKICCENGLALRAHTLVWHSQSPTWFFKKDYNGSNAFVDAKTMDARLEMYVKTVMSHVYSNEYGKCVYAWDVVNEYPHASKDNWLAVYGECGNTPEFVKKAFVYANEVLERYKLEGQVSLLFNDYNTYMEVEKVISIVNFINSDKKVCTGVGMQSHVATWYPSVDYFTAALKSFLNAGLEVQITEMDIKSNRKDDEQAAYAYQLFKNINNIKKNGGNITSVTWWGFADEMSWIKEDSALLFSKLDEPKAAYTSVLKAYTEVLGTPKGVKDPAYVDPTKPVENPVNPGKDDPVVDPVDPGKDDPVVDPAEPDKPVTTGLKAEYTINNWGSGYQVLIKVKNETGKRAESWSLKVNKNDCKIDSSWNVNIVEAGDYYVITPMVWNSVIENDNAVEFGVQGNGNIGASVEIIVVE